MGGVTSRHAEGGLDQANWQATAQELMAQSGVGQQRVELRLAAHGLPKKDKLRWGSARGHLAALQAAAGDLHNLASIRGRAAARVCARPAGRERRRRRCSRRAGPRH